MQPAIATCPIPPLDDAAFEETVRGAPHPLLVQFVEKDCHACDLARRSLADVLGKSPGGVRGFCVHGPSAPQATARYRVAQFPTILLFRNGRVSRRLVGHPLPGQLEVIIRSEIAAPPARATPPARD